MVMLLCLSGMRRGRVLSAGAPNYPPARHIATEYKDLLPMRARRCRSSRTPAITERTCITAPRVSSNSPLVGGRAPPRLFESRRPPLGKQLDKEIGAAND